MSELSNAEQIGNVEAKNELDCSRCLRLLVDHALDGSATPTELSLFADSVEPTLSKKTNAGPEILSSVCRVEACEEVSILYRSAHRGPSPVTIQGVQFPGCVNR